MPIFIAHGAFNFIDARHTITLLSKTRDFNLCPYQFNMDSHIRIFHEKNEKKKKKHQSNLDSSKNHNRRSTQRKDHTKNNLNSSFMEHSKKEIA